MYSFGDFMRFSMRSFGHRIVAVGITLLGSLPGISFAADGDGQGRSSVVNSRVSTRDLEPLAAVAAIQRSELVVVPSLGHVPLAIDSADTSLRTSVPSSNRSGSLFRSGEVFANSAAVLPLLVGDLEPPASPVSRPLAGGRLVGARPSLPINRNPLTGLPLVRRSSN
jgi:hypothetical protein